MYMENHKNLPPGSDKHYQAYIGPPYEYDLMGARQFTLLFNLGIRETAKILDFGCGSLRLGRLLINWLNKGNYYGIDPNKWLIDEAIKNEIGNEIINIKNPNFSYNDNFDSSIFNVKFNYIIAQSIFSHTTFPLFKRVINNLINNLNENGILLFTCLTNKMSKGSEYDKNQEKWVYPTCAILEHDEIINFINSIGYCTDIKGYHSIQTWFIFSMNKDIIETAKENKNNLTDLPFSNTKLWDYSKLKYNCKK